MEKQLFVKPETPPPGVCLLFDVNVYVALVS